MFSFLKKAFKAVVNVVKKAVETVVKLVKTVVTMVVALVKTAAMLLAAIAKALWYGITNLDRLILDPNGFFEEITDTLGLGKDGFLTNFIQDNIPFAGLVTAAVHAMAGNDKWAEYAATKGLSTGVQGLIAAAGAFGGPLGGAIGGAIGAAAAAGIESGFRELLDDEVKDKIPEFDPDKMFDNMVAGGALGGLGATARVRGLKGGANTFRKSNLPGKLRVGAARAGARKAAATPPVFSGRKLVKNTVGGAALAKKALGGGTKSEPTKHRDTDNDNDKHTGDWRKRPAVNAYPATVKVKGVGPKLAPGRITALLTVLVLVVFGGPCYVVSAGGADNVKVATRADGVPPRYEIAAQAPTGGWARKVIPGEAALPAPATPAPATPGRATPAPAAPAPAAPAPATPAPATPAPGPAAPAPTPASSPTVAEYDWILRLVSGAPQGAENQPILLRFKIVKGAVSGTVYDPYLEDMMTTSGTIDRALRADLRTDTTENGYLLFTGTMSSTLDYISGTYELFFTQDGHDYYYKGNFTMTRKS